MSCKPGDHDYTDCTRFNCAVALAEEGGTQPSRSIDRDND